MAQLLMTIYLQSSPHISLQVSLDGATEELTQKQEAQGLLKR